MEPDPAVTERTDGEPDASTARLLGGLNPEQSRAVTDPARHLRVLAGAGSGKTRVLTHRIAYRSATLTLSTERTLAVTFTRKAAGELRDRLHRLLPGSAVHAGTFHAIAYAQLRQRWEERGVRPPELLDRKLGFLARLVPRRRGDSTLALDVLAEIEWASARALEPDDYAAAAAAARRRPPLEPDQIAGIWQDFADRKRQRRLVDFDDLLRLAARDLAADPEYAAARHWRFRHLFVDEFQDVNPLQFRLLSRWLGSGSDLCVVGDPNQAIYAWNGADASYLERFEEHFPEAASVTLSDNYRSTPQILAAANAVLAQGPRPVVRLVAHRPSGPAPTVRSHDDERAEANAVARALRDGHRPGVPWSQQAVLVRTNAQTAAIAEACGTAGVPHRVRGAGSLLEFPEVKDALDSIRRSPSLEVALADLAADVDRRNRRALRSDERAPGGRPSGPARDADDAVEGPGAPGEPDGSGTDVAIDDRAANVAEVVRLGHEYRSLDPTGGTGGFIAWLVSTLRNEDAASGGDAVEIVTFHAAKGLEWSTVHVAGLEQGLVPIHHAQDDPDSVDEERRLLYVALTRARESLHCHWARRRTFGTRASRRSPSPWLDAIATAVGAGGNELTPAQSARRAAGARSGGARQRTASSSTDLVGTDRALFERLRSWRRDQARAADVPAFVIFNDAVLQEVARRRPDDRAALLEVPGIGPVKAERFGDDLLEIVAGAD
ncbi:MAG: ATP-dependent helicase [Microthrixaceae bacterium]